MALCSVQDLRDEQIDPSATDQQLANAIALASDYISRVTEQVFRPVVYTADQPLVLDGSGTDCLILPIPIISLLSLVEMGSVLDPTTLLIMNRVGPPEDDRQFPRICKKPFTTGLSGGFGGYAYVWGGVTGRIASPVFVQGRGTVALAGTFGYCEADGLSPPPGIVEICKQLVFRLWRPKGDPLSREERMKAQVSSRSTMGASMTLTGLVASAGPTGDPDIDDALAYFRRRGGGNTMGSR